MLAPALAEVLAAPRRLQPAALRVLRARLPPRAEPEAWNSRFGPGTLYDAWGRSTLMRGLYAANAALVRARLPADRPVDLLELGGGDGRLWRQALPAGTRGRFTLVDPVPGVADQVRANLPPGLELAPRVARVEDLLARGEALPEADLAVCSLVLHHVAGRDADDRAARGLDGPGKGEVLDALRRALAPRRGTLLVNEADVHCEIDLPPGDPLLEERMLDSYVRRCAVALLRDVASRPDADEDLRARWEAVVLHWCLEQLDLAHRPLAARDVYELDRPRWVALFAARGWTLCGAVPTDDDGLFWQYHLIAT